MCLAPWRPAVIRAVAQIAGGLVATTDVPRLGELQPEHRSQAMQFGVVPTALRNRPEASLGASAHESRPISVNSRVKR